MGKTPTKKKKRVAKSPEASIEKSQQFLKLIMTSPRTLHRPRG